MAGEAAFSYDVYISFRGEDTRYSFTSHLYGALRQRGILTFNDFTTEKGDEVWPAIYAAIEQSRIAIIVFSKNYASSKWCLEELATILECFKDKKDRVVLPVFYGVDPSHVRKQAGSYGEAFARYEAQAGMDHRKINTWRMALHQAADLAGFDSRMFPYDVELIKIIIEAVVNKLQYRPPVHLRVADHPVGLESRMLKVMSLLDVGSDNGVRIVGIHGIGGVGKSTIARAVYNSICDHFEGLCFLEDIGANSAKYGLVHFQEMALSEILGDTEINLRNVSEGIMTIKDRLHQKKILLVLDDVVKIEQLEAIVGGHDWFGSGSRVIITTRDDRLLTLHGVESSYRVEELSDKEALDLITWNAFRSDKVDPSFTGVLSRVLTYASGIPLALRVMGSYLFGRSVDEWNDALNRIEMTSDREIQELLKISYDGLEHDEQGIFLDIACFFNGHKLADIEDILCAHHGLSTKVSIEALIEKSLITIDDGLVTLHDLIQDLGREIVRQESPDQPGQRSRLWFFKDVVKVLEENTGSDTIESLFLDFPKDVLLSNGPRGEEVYWDGRGLMKMVNLKVLIIRNGHFNKCPTHLPNGLRVLKWYGYPSESLPEDFHPKKLAILELPESQLRISEPIQWFVCLTVLDFGYCEWITRIPDVSGLPNLEKLSFKHCENIIQIHESVGFLDKLKILDAVRCKKLRNFPSIRMTSLEQLNLSHCSVLESFPEILGKMENITELHVTGSPIKELPFSIQNLSRLQKLELQLCGMVQLPSSIVMLPELGLMCVSQCEGLLLSKLHKGEELESKSSNAECLILSHCNISDDFLPTGLTWFSNVKDLNLSGNDFTNLHSCIKECHLLRKLKLDGCSSLQEIRGIPMKLETLSAKDCRSLKYMDLTIHQECIGECHSLRELILDDCAFLKEIKGVLPNLDHFSAKNCTSLSSMCTSMLLNQESVEAGNKMFSMPGTKVPDWFAHRTRGESISFWFRNKFPSITLCLVFGLVHEQPTTVKFSPIVFVNGNKLFLGNRKVYEFSISTDHILVSDIKLLKCEDNMDLVLSDNKWNRMEVSYVDHTTNREFPIKLVATYSGIHVSEQTSGMGDIQFTNPPQAMINENLDSDSMEERQRKVQTMVLSTPILTSTKPPAPKAEKGLSSQQTPSAWRPWEDVAGEISERLLEDEVHFSTVQNDPAVIERCHEGDDVEVEAASSGELESEKSFSSAGSDSDDPFNQVDRKLSVNGKEAMSSGASSRDASLASIREAIDALELLMVKDLTEVYSDPATQSQLFHFLDLLVGSSHHKVTVEVKEALVEFRRKAFASLQEFLATVESVNKLKNFEKQKTRIQKEVSAGKDRWKDLKNSIKKASSAIKTENSRKKELEAEIVTLRKQLATKEIDLEQLVLNVKNLEADLSTYRKNCDALGKEARALSKEADYLVTANSGVEDEGKAAEVKQNLLNSIWSTELTSQLSKIKNNILGLSG